MKVGKKYTICTRVNEVTGKFKSEDSNSITLIDAEVTKQMGGTRKVKQIRIPKSNIIGIE